jgi:hypothetical protein
MQRQRKCSGSANAAAAHQIPEAGRVGAGFSVAEMLFFRLHEKGGERNDGIKDTVDIEVRELAGTSNVYDNAARVPFY